ncbi:MAG: hypothetical protein IJ667_00990 [Synergistaceae bacterium]|nr:hypothetical protein [Synergistaceae bacterium]
MTDSQRSKCHAIIHTATAACAAVGGGMAQLPGSDTVPITAAQVTMIISLGAVFGRKLSKSAATGILKGLGGAAVGRLVSQIAFGWIPGLGNAINAATAVAITEKIGWAAANKFDNEYSEEMRLWGNRFVGEQAARKKIYYAVAIVIGLIIGAFIIYKLI